MIQNFCQRGIFIDNDYFQNQNISTEIGFSNAAYQNDNGDEQVMITVQPIKEIDGDVEVTKVDDISLGTRIYDIIVLSDYNLKNVAVCKYVLL